MEVDLKTCRLLLITAILVFVSCPGGVDHIAAPQNIGIASDFDGLSVRLYWDPDTLEEVDGYLVYFEGRMIDTTKTNGYIHSKPGITGEYYATAFKGEVVSSASNRVNNKPLAGKTIVIRDINSQSPHGFGWTRDSGFTTSHPMTDSANITRVDLYITNFRRDTTSTPYYLASPILTQTDSSVNWVLTGTKHTNGFTAVNFNLDNADTVPDYGYDPFGRITAGKTYCAYTQDGYFGLINITRLDSVAGNVEFQTLFQPIRYLRLFKKSP